VSTERVFSDEELRIAGMRSVDAIEEALTADDRDDALRYARRLRREVLSMIQNYSGWETTLLGWVDRNVEGQSARDVLAVIEDFESAPERGGDGSDPVDRWRAEGATIAEEIEARDDEAAISRARALHDEALRRHDRGMSRVSAILSFIGRQAGLDGIGKALQEAMSSGMLGNQTFRERAEALMHFTRVHLQSFDLLEDDEKITFRCRICPSAGRMIAAGHYEAPRSDLMVQGPHPLTYGRDEIPVYCCHEPIMETDSFESTGVPLFIVDPAERLGFEPCNTYLYKNSDDIPERFYTRLGLEKPAPKGESKL
jgi:hypothetical protein